MEKTKKTLEKNVETDLESPIFLDIAKNYARIFPEGYYIEVENNKTIKVYNPEGEELYTAYHNLEKLIEKKDGEIVYKVTSKSNVDLMVEDYGKNQIKKIMGVPTEVMKTHKKIKIIEKIVEIPSEVVIEKEVPYEVEVYVEKEIDIFQHEIYEKFKDLPEIKIPIDNTNQLSTSFLRDAASLLIRKSDDYKYERSFKADLRNLRNIEVFNEKINVENLYGIFCKDMFSSEVIQKDSAVVKLGHSFNFSTLPAYKGSYYDKPDCLIFISLQNRDKISYLKLHDVVKLSLDNVEDFLLI